MTIELQAFTTQLDIIINGFKAGQSMKAIATELKSHPGKSFSAKGIRDYLHRHKYWEYGWERPKWEKSVHGSWFQTTLGHKVQ